MHPLPALSVGPAFSGQAPCQSTSTTKGCSDASGLSGSAGSLAGPP